MVMITTMITFALIVCFLIPIASTQWQNDIRATLNQLMESGRSRDVLEFIEEIETDYGTLAIDNHLPSLYSYKAFALHESDRRYDAIEVFKQAIAHIPNGRSWINLGELQLQSYDLLNAMNSYSEAYQYGEIAALPGLVVAKGWSAHWLDFEGLSSQLENLAIECFTTNNCQLDNTLGLEYVEMNIYLKSLIPIYKESSTLIDNYNSAAVYTPNDRMKVGLMSSDFGHHPVATMMRGMIQLIDKTKIELYVFGLNKKLSWFGVNITDTVEHMIWLTDMNSIDAANVISQLGINILIDLNGLTESNGLSIFAHRPSPLQITYLGSPTTTGTTFIDYFIGDFVVVPAEHRSHYSESLILLSTCYLVNDFAQVQPSILNNSSPSRRASVSEWEFAPTFTNDNASSLNRLKGSSMLFATLSSASKIDPTMFQVWMNILRRYPTSTLLLLDYAAYNVSAPNLLHSAFYYGVIQNTVQFVKRQEWSKHLYTKTSLDMILDTKVKSGHSTGLDGVWAGVPTISFAGGSTAQQRAGESIATTLESEFGLVYTLKEYEDIAIQFIQHKRKYKLEVWRKFVGNKRLTSGLFDTKQFTITFMRMLEASWELSMLTNHTKRYHIF